MSLPELLARIVRLVLRRPAVVVAVVGALAVAGGAYAAVTLRASGDVGSLVGHSSAAARATDDYHQRFGDDAVYVLVRERLVNLIDTDDLARLFRLEGCLGGNVPKGATPYGGSASPCARLAATKPVQALYGPATFLNATISQIQDSVRQQLVGVQARQRKVAAAVRKAAAAQGKSHAEQERLVADARKLVLAAAENQLATFATKYGLSANMRFGDPSTMNKFVFDPEIGPGVPKARLAYLFPNPNAALVQVRLRPDLTDAQRQDAIAAITAATRMPAFRLAHGKPYVVTGAPVVLSSLTTTVGDSIVVLLLGALLVMALVLALVFRVRLRLAPLLVALVAAGLVFGGMALAGASLTMASIAVLPILVGLGVDYAIQLQSRQQEARAAGADDRAAALHAARHGAPAVAVACLATAAGFLVLLLSPVPMVRGFGVLLVVGVLVAFACAVTLGSAVLSLSGGGRRGGGGRAGAAVRGAAELLGPIARAPRRAAAACGRALARAVRRRSGAAAFGDRGGQRWPVRSLRAVGARIVAAWAAALALSVRRPAAVLGTGVLLAVLGLAAGTQTHVVSDIQKLVPQSSPAVRDLDTLQRATGVSGEVDVLVRTKDLTDPAVIEWMSDYQKTILARYGYSASDGCGKAALCPALSLPDLLSGAGKLTRKKVAAVFDALPPYLSQAVITRDRTTAALAFGIRLMPLDEQERVVDAMRRELDPPPGVHAELAGLPVLAADANAAVSSNGRRLIMLGLGLLAVALVLLAVFRRWQRAFVPLVPIALASGWSALVLFLLRIPLNPMSVTLGTLVIAIATEFSVLLSERFREERAAGHDRRAALERTYRSTGRAVLASGSTAIAGFAVLMLSDIRMLRDFGAVTVIDLAVSLLGVMIVLPSALVLAEEGELHRLPLRALARVWALRPRRPRRTTTAA